MSSVPLATLHESEPPQAAGSLLADLVQALKRPDLAAALIIVAQLLVYAAVALPGSFYLDDLAATNRAAGLNLSFDYLKGQAGHHIAPGSLLWLWLQAHVAPLDHRVAVMVALAVQGLVSLALWALLRSLFGSRPLTLVPLAVYAFTPLTMPAFAWWIQSVCLLPVHLSIILATHQQVAYLRTRRFRHLAGVTASVAFGLCFWEKALLAAVLPTLVTVLCFTHGPGLRARMRYLLSLWPAWAALALAPATFLFLYGNSSAQPVRSVTGSQVAELLWDSTTHAVLPSLLGGPWRWTTKEYYGIADPTLLHMVLSGVIVLLVVVLTVRRRRAAWRGWALLLLYVPLSLAPVIAGRLAQYGLAIGRDSRYLTDIAVAAAIGIGLALMPLREQAPVRAVTEEHLVTPRRPLARALPVAFALALLASSAVSTLHFANRWHDNPTGAYIAHATTDLKASGASVALFDGQLPDTVLTPLYAPYNFLSSLLGQLPGKTRFEDGLSPLDVVRADGHIVSGVLQPGVRSLPGPSGSCGYALTPNRSSVTLPFGSTVFAFIDRTIRVELLLSAPTAVTVKVSDGTTSHRVGSRVVLPRGPAAVVTLVPDGDLASVKVEGLAPGAYACVLSVTVGRPVPLAGG